MIYPVHQQINGRTMFREPTVPSIEALKGAIEATAYKYFGYYEMTEDQFSAVETLVQFALHYIHNNEKE